MNTHRARVGGSAPNPPAFTALKGSSYWRDNKGRENPESLCPRKRRAQGPP